MEQIKTLNQSSLEIKKNSKGYTWGIKVYGDTEEEIDTKMNNMIQKAENQINNQKLKEELR